jgi:hypothetical protein
MCSQSFILKEYLTKIESSILSILERPSRKNAELDILSIPQEQKILNNALHLKQIQMKYGEIWQTVLGEYDGFTNLKTGHPSGLDIMSTSRKLIIELKNSYNTDNSSSKRANLDKLAAFKKLNEDYTAIYGVINEKHDKNEKNFGCVKTIIHNDIPILYYSGDKLFELLLGNDSHVIINKVIEIVQAYKLKNI